MKVEAGNIETIKWLLRTVPDFPKPGILFYDITTVLQEAKGLKAALDVLEGEIFKDPSWEDIDVVAGIESRGFILGAALADRLGKGFVLIRKRGKLPGGTHRIEYGLEYGQDVLEISDQANCKDGKNVLLIDDLLATGGTAKAAIDLITMVGGNVQRVLFLIELLGLGGREKIGSTPIQAVIAVPA